MTRRRLAVLGILIGVAFLLGLFASLLFVLPRLAGQSSGVIAYNTSTVLRQVRSVSELITVQYVLEKVVILEAPPETMLGQMFAGDNRLLLLAHGIVKAGVDLSQIKAEDVKVDGRKVRIKLPPARITDAYLDERQTRVIERTTGLFRSFDKDLEQSARLSAVDDIRRAARLCGILKDADERARAQLRLFLEAGGLEVEFVSP